MAKALIGFVNTDRHHPRLIAENARLRSRVADLEAVVLRLAEENDHLLEARPAEFLDPQMQPA